MAQTFNIEAESRTQLGKAANRRLRRLEDHIPGVVYGAGKEAAAIRINHNAIKNALDHEAFYSHILTLKVDGTSEKVILRAVQRHPFKPKIVHVDFLRISEKEKLTMNIPLHFKGEDVAPGVKAGGVVSHLETTVEVSCLPADLPEYIDVDISNLDLDASIHLSNLKLPKGVESVALSHENDLPVVSIHVPRAAIEETETPVAVEGEEAAAAPAEGEEAEKPAE